MSRCCLILFYSSNLTFFLWCVHVLLNRTGKTVCICNRMELDRQRYQHDPSFTQLFTSRSARLCKYVKEVVGADSSGSQCFSTFRELLYQLESSLPRMDKSNQRFFSPSHHVDFYRFEREFYHQQSNSVKGMLGALLVWKSELFVYFVHFPFDVSFSIRHFTCPCSHSNFSQGLNRSVPKSSSRTGKRLFPIRLFGEKPMQT